jgi:tellurite resistance protein TerC
MVSVLPDNKEIEWPCALQGLAKIINPLAGKQQTAALRVGLLGAYLGRGIMLVLASFVIQNPWLRLIGAIYLICLAFENLGMSEKGEEEQHNQNRNAAEFWMVVFSVELADLAFSLDNVVAAVSLSDNLWIVMLGVAIGILTMRFAAGLFSKAVVKEPILKPAAYILVLNIGVQLILEDLARLEIPDMVRFALSLSIISLALIYAHSKQLQRIRPLLVWLAQGMENVNELVKWFLVPISFIFRGLFSVVKGGIGMIMPKPTHEIE